MGRETDGVVVEGDNVFLVGGFAEITVVGGDDEDAVVWFEARGRGDGFYGDGAGELTAGDVRERGDGEVEVSGGLLVNGQQGEDRDIRGFPVDRVEANCFRLDEDFVVPLDFGDRITVGELVRLLGGV